jgi:hypothetical protein
LKSNQSGSNFRPGRKPDKFWRQVKHDVKISASWQVRPSFFGVIVKIAASNGRDIEQKLRERTKTGRQVPRRNSGIRICKTEFHSKLSKIGFGEKNLPAYSIPAIPFRQRFDQTSRV